MISDEASTQIAHSMLSVLSKDSSPTFRIFYADYRALFSPARVPIIRTFEVQSGNNNIVDIDRKAAIAYLTDRYNFVTRSELGQILSETAKDFVDAE